jgi:hypothetical protein
MFASVETVLERADRGCQLWDHEVSGASSLIVNTLYFLELDFFQRCAAERAREAIVAYADSRCIAALHALKQRDESLRELAYAGLRDLRGITAKARVNARFDSLKVA